MNEGEFIDEAEDELSAGRLFAVSNWLGRSIPTSGAEPPYARDSPNRLIASVSNALERKFGSFTRKNEGNYTKAAMWFNLLTYEPFDPPANVYVEPQYITDQFALVTTFITGSQSMLYFPSASQLTFISVVVTPSMYLTDNEGRTLVMARAEVASSSSDAQADLQKAYVSAAVTSVVIFFAGMLAAHLVARELNRPMERLLTAIRRLRALDFRESYRHPDDEARSELSASTSEAASAGASAAGSANASKTPSSSLSRGGRRRQALGAAM